MAQDKNLSCRDCGAQFIFTASEQEFFAEKGFTNDPSRCPDCRKSRKQNTNNNFSRNSNNNRQRRETFSAVCASCGVQTQVPFRPSSDRPVYCRDCYSQQNNRRY